MQFLIWSVPRIRQTRDVQVEFRSQSVRFYDEIPQNVHFLKIFFDLLSSSKAKYGVCDRRKRKTTIPYSRFLAYTIYTKVQYNVYGIKLVFWFIENLCVCVGVCVQAYILLAYNISIPHTRTSGGDPFLPRAEFNIQTSQSAFSTKSIWYPRREDARQKRTTKVFFSRFIPFPYMYIYAYASNTRAHSFTHTHALTCIPKNIYIRVCVRKNTERAFYRAKT